MPASRWLKRREATLSGTWKTDMQALRKISGHRWQKLRERILLRDASLCQQCKARGHITLAVEVDHITTIHKGGTDAEDNLQAICSECHKAKTAAEQGKAALNMMDECIHVARQSMRLRLRNML